MYIDTHCHLDFSEYISDRKEILGRARMGGVEAIVNVGTNLSSSQWSADFAEEEGDIYAAVGIHPSEAHKVSYTDFSEIEKLCSRKKIVAMGETGLDYYRAPETKRAQKELFSCHVKYARDYGIPLIVHQRDAQDEVLEILDRDGPVRKVIFHCFSGDPVLLNVCRERRWYISFTGIITFPNARDLQKSVEEAPLDLICAETDAPFLAPIPYRGKRNEPLYVKYVVQKIASIKSLPEKEVAEKIRLNSLHFFSLL
ncbi:MAG: TatD family hydrolase [Candidatus Ratteibacteria bacterium]